MPQDMHYIGDSALRTDQRTEQTEILRFDDVLESMLRHDPNALNALKMGEEINSIEYRWFEAEPMKRLITANDAIATPADDAETHITLATATDYVYFSAGDVIMDIAAPLEQMIVLNNDAGGHIDVTRAAYGSTIQAHAAGAVYRIMDRPQVENSSPDVNRVIQPHYAYNVIETLERYITLSRHEIKTKQHAVSDILAWNVKEATLDVKDELFYAAWYGMWSNPVRGNKTVARRMRGIYGMLTATTDADSRTVTPNLISAARVFSKDLIDEMSASVDDLGGKFNNGKATFYCNPQVYDLAHEIWDDKVWIKREDTVRGLQVKSVLAKRGHEVTFCPDHRIPVSHCFMLNDAKVSLHPFVGANWVLEPYAKISDGVRYRLMGDYTVKLKDAQKDHCVASNVSLS